MEKTEALSETSRIEFSELEVGNIIEIVTGREKEAWTYKFEITDTTRKWPDTNMTAINPAGEEIGPIRFSMHGCGRWTSRQENPVQDQVHAFTPYYDGLIVGNFLWGKPEGASERIVMDKPGQEITRIQIVA